MDDEEKEDGERVSLVILSLPSRRWDTLEERFDLSPLCPANKRDNFSNLNRTPFESTGWNELEEHHYVKQIYPRARRGVTWFRWKKKGSFLSWEEEERFSWFLSCSFESELQFK